MAVEHILFSLGVSLLLFSKYSNSQFMSPCPDFFLYQQRDDSTDRWYGLINLESKIYTTGVNVTLTLDNPALALGTRLGDVITYDFKAYIITNRKFSLGPNQPHLLRFFVNYDTANVPPKLVSIEQNGQLVCSQFVPPTFTSVFVNTTESKITPPGTIQGYNLPECGTTVVQATPLILDGITTEIGMYPWNAAIFYHQFNREPRYICGGSLISRQYIITAANCFTCYKLNNCLLRRNRTEPTEFTVHLGKGFLLHDSLVTQVFEVSDLIIHPQYNRRTSVNDIALVKLKGVVDFTDDPIRPICLWEGDPDYDKIVTKTGNVVGWNSNEIIHNRHVLRQAEMIFVSNEDCLKTNPEFYLTKSSYCAGYKTGITCVNDGGAGMVFLKEITGRKIYYLRGISSYGRPYCNKTSFEVFTDVTTQLDFIKANLQ